MSAFLELCQSVRQQAGLSGSGPSSVAAQIGMDAKIVDWVNAAWYDIQSLHPNWRWMWKNDGAINTVASQREYDLAGLGFDINYIIRETPKRRPVGVPGSEMWMQWYEYDDFRQTFLFGPLRYGIPIATTVTPAGNMLLDPIPNDIYEVFFEYHKKPALLVANNDTPDIPEKFHRMIVYKALMYYAAHDDALGVYQAAEKEYNAWERRLEAEQLVSITIGGTLA